MVLSLVTVCLFQNFTPSSLAKTSWRKDLSDCIEQEDTQKLYERSTINFLNRFKILATFELDSLRFNSDGEKVTGSYGHIFTAFDHFSKTDVVIKVMDLFTYKNSTLSSLAEGIVLNEIKHPGLVAGLGSYFIPHPLTGNFCVAYILPLAIGDLIENSEVPDEKLHIGLYNIFSAIDFLHSLGLLHGDIKLDNVLQFKDQSLKLCDFGSVRRFLPDSPYERSNPYTRFSCGKYVTSLVCAPPEVLDNGPITKHMDTWELGILLYNTSLPSPLYAELPQLRNLVRRNLQFGFVNLNKEHQKDIPESARKLMELLLIIDPNQRFFLDFLLENHDFFAPARANMECQRAINLKSSGDLSGFTDWQYKDIRMTFETLKSNMDRWQLLLKS